MLCENCHQNPVAVHMQQIINGEKTELHLCQECASQIEMPISFDNFFQGFMDAFFVPVSKDTQEKSKAQAIRCQCGISFSDFKKTGRLGCSACYDTFRTELSAILKNMQGSNMHQGKFPQKSGQTLLHKRKIEQLRADLAKAIEKEEYEDAAKFRDEIREMEQQTM